MRLNNAYNKQVERMNNIKADEDKYNEWLINNKIIQSKSYYKRVETPAVRIQQVKNNLIILAHDLLVSKKIHDLLYRKIQDNSNINAMMISLFKDYYNKPFNKI